MRTYKRKRDGSVWKRIPGTFPGCQRPIEMRGEYTTIYISYAELRDDFEEVDRCPAPIRESRPFASSTASA